MNTPNAATIALIDDDQNIRTSVAMALEAEGFAVRPFTDGVDAWAGIEHDRPDLIVLDIKMPRMDGTEFLTLLRRHDTNLPVIFLTSKDDEVDEIIGLQLGADDYIAKPFSQRVLLARIRALLRRRDLGQSSNEEDEHTDAKIVRGDLVLDEDRHLCSWRGEIVDLTVTEYLLLKSLAMRPGHVKNRERLMDEAYGDNIHVDDRTIDSHIKRLRKKLKKADPDFERIETLYGVGYRYKED